MNRLFYFMTGSLSTLTVNGSMNLSGCDSFLITQLVSLVGGVLSTVIIVYLEQRWRRKQE